MTGKLRPQPTWAGQCRKPDLPQAAEADRERRINGASAAVQPNAAILSSGSHSVIPPGGERRKNHDPPAFENEC
ncbi:MAG: hypothetical protein ABJZ74_08805, partial [Nitratireductor sp.]